MKLFWAALVGASVVFGGLALAMALDDDDPSCEGIDCVQDCELSQEVVDAYEGRPSRYETVSEDDYERAVDFLEKSCSAATPTVTLT